MYIIYDFVFIFIINTFLFIYLFIYLFFLRLFFLGEISYTATLVNPRWNKGDVWCTRTILLDLSSL